MSDRASCGDHHFQPVSKMDRQEEVKLTENLNLSENDSLALQTDLKEGSPIKEEQDSQIASDTNAKKSKGTKRKASIDLQLYTCEVCQVKLNSASQAYQHFQGKTHRGKVKMLEMAAEVVSTHNFEYLDYLLKGNV